MEFKDIKFLAYADMVSKRYERRIAKLHTRYEQAVAAGFANANTSRFAQFSCDVVRIGERLDALYAEADAHKKRWCELQRQRDREIEINRLCAEASKLSGVDGIFFMGKVRRCCIEKESEFDD